jgi:hypothetical protein
LANYYSWHMEDSELLEWISDVWCEQGVLIVLISRRVHVEGEMY